MALPPGIQREGPSASADMRRVLALPRRPQERLDPESPRTRALVELAERRLRRPDRPLGAACGCAAMGRRCIDRLLPAQAWAHYEIPLAGGGLFGAIGVGAGKTVLDITASMSVPNARVGALFVPPGLVLQLRQEYLAVREHWLVPSLVLPDSTGFVVPGAPVLHVVPYSMFSREGATALLETLRPDHIVADEAHLFKNRLAVRTGRFLRYMAAHPGTRFLCWSGSVASRSVRDFAHLLAYALGEGSPLPVDPDEWDAWAAALDPSDWPAAPGLLRELCEPGEDVRAGFARRLLETRGVVSTRSNASCGASLVMRERKPAAVPAEVRRMMKDLRASWTRPDGEELVSALDVARCARELALGFYYRWVFPGQPRREDVLAWFSARQDWNRELREQLKHPEPHLDSPLLLAKAAIRHYQGYRGELPTWASQCWPRWRDLRDTVEHETEAVWVDRYLAEDAAAWATRGAPGIVWYEQGAFGRAVGEISGLPVHGGGPEAEARILAETGRRSIVASVRSHGTGRNGLQRLFARQLVTMPPASGDAWEQLLGRLHRVGQEADEVVTEVYRHTEDLRDAVDRALELAKFIEGVTCNAQKLRCSDVEWLLKS